jgi:uncharacterized membrane protein YjgN (DUF898 family)
MSDTVLNVEQAEASRIRNEQFTFTGSASEYFRIWIVNLFLTIITIGIYSPWAKVRRLKYFYGNTWLDSHNFDYVANPVSILKGRAIVVALLVLYNVLVNLVHPLFGLLAIVYLIFLPWIVNKSLSFNARMTIYRNVRFGFEGTLWNAFKAFVLWPLASALTLGLLTPFTSRATSNYIGSNAKYGAADFTTQTKLGTLYRNFGRTFCFIFCHCWWSVVWQGFRLPLQLPRVVLNKAAIWQWQHCQLFIRSYFWRSFITLRGFAILRLTRPRLKAGTN